MLLIPIVVPLVTVLFNAKSPTLFGFPRFYWLQLAFLLLGVGSDRPGLPDDPQAGRAAGGE